MIKKIILFIAIVFFSIPANAIVSEQNAVQIAQDALLREISQEIRSEFILVGITSPTYDESLYDVNWARYINGISVAKDGFSVKIKKLDGSIYATNLRYSFASSELDLTFTISQDQAKWIADKKKWTLQRNPEFQIREKRLIWFLKLDNNCEATLDAKTGETKILGCPTSASLSNPPIEFNPTQYYLEVYSPYLLILTIIIIGGAFYFWKHPFSQNKK